MRDPQTSQDAFLELMRQELERPDLSFDEAMRQPLAKTLYDMLARNLEPAAQAPARQAAPSLASFAQSRSVVQAAIQDTFDLEDLGPDPDERSALIRNADVVMLGGKRRLRLTDSARAELLAAASNTDLYRKALGDALVADKRQFDAVGADPVRLPTAWLRAFLASDFGNLDIAPPAEVAAALAARERLRLVSGLAENVPTIADLERRVAMAQLLEPLRVLIGDEGGWDGTPRRDRFVGREPELANLRAFVDELSSQSTGESLRRWSAAVTQAVSGAERPILRLVQADGGLGKSALLAKFILDHALDQKRPFPFAYLDFDRAALDAEQPHQLLIEIARQVGLQFPQAQPGFSAMTQEIRQQRVQPSRTDAPAAAAIRDPYANFVEILRRHATFGDRAFLLILDTLEIVQWNPSALSKLAGMLLEFRKKGLVELRVVVSGRADVPELRKAAGIEKPEENIRLRALSSKEAAEMAQRLGRAAIQDAWSASWSNAIAGEAPGSRWFETVKRALSPRDDVRREPLTVRVAVDLIVQAPPPDRQKIVDEIQSLTEDSQTSLAARLYARRILNHVRDERAQKLAWPGLVLRRVTREIARELLAPLCGLAPQDVDGAFECLGAEVWMVAREGDALKHRPDLRARTLPLMRANDRVTFDRTAQEAVKYFGEHRDRSIDDRAEWIYHRLLAGEAIDSVVPDLTPDIFQKLAGAEEDFSPDSQAASYIASRTAGSRLPPGRIRRLSPKDALYHLSATSPGFFGLDDAGVDQIALDLSTRLGSDPDTIGNALFPWARALWVKTGAWRNAPPLPPPGAPLNRTHWRSHIFWAARISPSLPEAERRRLLRVCLRGITSEWREQDAPGLRIAVHIMALARVCESPEFEQLDTHAAKLLSAAKPNPMASLQAALRTAIVLGDACRGHALGLWLLGRRRGTQVRVQEPTFSVAELLELARIHSDVESLAEWKVRAGEAPSRIADERIVTSVSGILDQLLAAPQNLGDGVSRVFACRDEDWIVPFGYAAERAVNGTYSDLLRKRIAGYSGSPLSKSQSGPPVWSDMLAAMRIADEAGDLTGFATLVWKSTSTNSPDAAAELAALLNYHDNWSRAVATLLAGEKSGRMDVAPEPDTPAGGPPAPGPILDIRDPQRGRWGGTSERDGRALRAVLESVEKDIFYFSLFVESTDGSPLEAPVVFHLHDSYPRSVVRIQRIVDGRRAALTDWNAYGVFTVGAQVKTRGGTWTSLEFDLVALQGLPQRFLSR